MYVMIAKTSKMQKLGEFLPFGAWTNRLNAGSEDRKGTMNQPDRKAVSSRRHEKPEIRERKKGALAPRVESRQHLRTAATRKALLEAASHVFVRDGFEASRIEDIAREAGRSRGAFYVNFSSKAEAFLALREQQFLMFEARFRKQLQGQTTREEQRQAVEELMVDLTLEKSYILLELEFKLFAIRHPRLLKRLAKKHFEVKREIEELRDLFPRGDDSPLAMQQRMLTWEAILEGFVLNLAFNSEVMTRKYIQSFIPQLARSFIDLSR
jgi:AcrR family transcriptional regulator